MKSFFITVLAFSLQFSACVGMAMAAEPIVESSITVVEFEEPMSPAFSADDVCTRAVRTWSISRADKSSGCQDTTSCIQSSSHMVHEKSAMQLYNYEQGGCSTHQFFPFESFSYTLPVGFIDTGPIPYHAFYPLYLTVRLE